MREWIHERRSAVGLVAVVVFLLFVNQTTEIHSCHDRRATRQIQIGNQLETRHSAERFRKISDSPAERREWRRIYRIRISRPLAEPIDCPLIPLLG